MLLNRASKEKLVSQMTEGFGKSKTIVLVNFQGLKVKEIQDLKRKLKEKQINFQIVKNSLLKIALKKANITIDEKLFDQPIGVIWGADDEVDPAKLAVEFKKTTEKLDIVGGIVNRNFADISIIKQLASLPSRNELYAKLVGSLNAPVTGLVNVLQGNLRSLVYILKQYQEKKV